MVMEKYKGRVALVTGASAGIGAAIVQALLREGLTVVGMARRVDQVKALELKDAPGKLHAIAGDVADESSILSVFKWIKTNLGGVDVLVNNAGVFPPNEPTDGKTEAWKRILDVNVLGLSICTREAVQDMLSRKVDDGFIIHVNSVAGHTPPFVSAIAMYTASKHAVKILLEGLRKDLVAKGSNIRVGEVSPGLVDTEGVRKVMPSSSLSKELKSSPALQPEDIADAVVYMLSRPQRVQALELKDAPGKLHAIAGDVADESSILSVFKWIKTNLGGVDVLVNNAGVFPPNEPTDFKTEVWKQILDVNVLGLSICTREAVQDMLSRKVDDGFIIHVNSVVGHVPPIVSAMAMYTASKHAVKILLEGLRKDLVAKGSNIRVGEVSPGVVDTEGVRREVPNSSLYKKIKNSPALQSEDIADAVMYMLSRPQRVQVLEMLVIPTGTPI